MLVDALLLISMISLGTVFVFEVREYRRVQALVKQLDALITTYTAAFNTVANAITSLEGRFSKAVEEHVEIENELIVLRTIVDVHNSALKLNPLLSKIEPPKAD